MPEFCDRTISEPVTDGSHRDLPLQCALAAGPQQEESSANLGSIRIPRFDLWRRERTAPRRLVAREPLRLRRLCARTQGAGRAGADRGHRRAPAPPWRRRADRPPQFQTLALILVLVLGTRT